LYSIARVLFRTIAVYIIKMLFHKMITIFSRMWLSHKWLLLEHVCQCACRSFPHLYS